MKFFLYRYFIAKTDYCIMAYLFDINNITSSLVEASASDMTQKGLSLVWTLVQKRTSVKSAPLIGDSHKNSSTCEEELQTFLSNFYSSRFWTEGDKKKAAEDISRWLSEGDITTPAFDETAELQINRFILYSSHSFYRYWTAIYKKKMEETASQCLSDEDETGCGTPIALPLWWTEEDTYEWHTYRSSSSSVYSYRYWQEQYINKMEEDCSQFYQRDIEKKKKRQTLAITEELFTLAVQQNGLALQCVNKQTERLCILAVQQNGLALQFVNDQFISDQAEELYGLISYCFALEHVKKIIEGICTAAVQQNGLALKYLLEKYPDEIWQQTNEICAIAVQQNGLALQYVMNQTEEICILAVQQNGLALKYVMEQTKEICTLAVQQNGLASKYLQPY